MLKMKGYKTILRELWTVKNCFPCIFDLHYDKMTRLFIMFKMKLLSASWDMLACSYNILAINTFKLGFFFAYLLSRRLFLRHCNRSCNELQWSDNRCYTHYNALVNFVYTIDYLQRVTVVSCSALKLHCLAAGMPQKRLPG